MNRSSVPQMVLSLATLATLANGAAAETTSPSAASPPAPAESATVVPGAAAPPPAPAATPTIPPKKLTLAETATPEPVATVTAPASSPAATVARGGAPPPSPASADRTSPIRNRNGNEAPVRSRFNVAVNVDTAWYLRRSYDLFSENDAAQNTGLSIGYTALVNGPMSLVPEIGFGLDDQSASSLYGGAIQGTTLNTKRFYGGVSLRYSLLSFLEVHGRLAGGASTIKATVTPGSDTSTPGLAAPVTPELTDTKTSPFVSLGAGVTIRTRDAAFETGSGALRSVVLGFTVEGGYVIAKSIDLTPAPESGSGRIRTTDATLGTLERSAPYARLSAFVRF